MCAGTDGGVFESFLERLYKAVKKVDPQALVTYVNFPTTEYLDLPFIDFVSFNVYLETREKLEGYLARLQNLAGEKPLVMAEIGLDSMRNGPEAQASTLEWQIRSTFATGCSGIFVFSWTDEWHRGGFDIDDWGFGLTDRNRNPKPSLASVSRAYVQVPFPADLNWPSISVVICTYNGHRTIRDCLEGLKKVDYPNFEVIVVNDGSTDGTEIIAKEYGFKVISIPNGGLSNARNVGMRAANGEIIAYTDDDAVPDPHWLTYLAATFLTTDHVGVGGPNIPPVDDGAKAECVANSPGDQFTYFLPTSRQNTFRAATWLSEKPLWRRSAVSTLSSGSPETTSIFAGGLSTADGHSVLIRLQWCGIIAAIP